MSDSFSLPTSALTTDRIDGQIESLRAMPLNGQKKLSEKQMRDTAKQFEEIVVRQLLKEMRKTVPKNGFIEDSHATEMYMDMVDDHLAKQLADASAIGIGDLIYDELKEKNEKIENPEDIQNNGEFKALPEKDKSPAEPKFMPLARDTETFMKLHSRNRMMELPSAKDPFMPFDRSRRVTTDRIENR